MDQLTFLFMFTAVAILMGLNVSITASVKNKESIPISVTSFTVSNFCFGAASVYFMLEPIWLEPTENTLLVDCIKNYVLATSGYYLVGGTLFTMGMSHKIKTVTKQLQNQIKEYTSINPAHLDELKQAINEANSWFNTSYTIEDFMSSKRFSEMLKHLKSLIMKEIERQEVKYCSERMTSIEKGLSILKHLEVVYLKAIQKANME